MQSLQFAILFDFLQTKNWTTAAALRLGTWRT
jgi:hypothetical protein